MTKEKGEIGMTLIEYSTVVLDESNEALIVPEAGFPDQRTISEYPQNHPSPCSLFLSSTPSGSGHFREHTHTHRKAEGKQRRLREDLIYNYIHVKYCLFTRDRIEYTCKIVFICRDGIE